MAAVALTAGALFVAVVVWEIAAAVVQERRRRKRDSE